ncbi:hypothetical protein GCM10010112_28400 [Actinoplanes lobatus]|uniref:Energy-coupling factor transporter ATP-binding protein EcfA2 n=1 Tax=Actinoplanes lobatus TaxID=113568 RepID=A0A7W7HQ21_9ACTN|nr:dynamin family protein [Actinoplanes lobatus]MBB4754550.1 energy-coupling factor transporter ATP-binding protein EcfA2 [Actinoplanes lobatus]GGN66213.1 hypothetical protein GCM10010112_28400 [Actinoplanes lobatus]GIE45915.1 hypothetical protein Alo02nite_88130 [Actinoplanes lobatus]
MSEAAIRFIADAAIVLDRLGDRAAVAAIRAEVDRLAGGAATVVVAGERGSGKSALINAMLGRPGLLPAEGGTAVHLLVRHSAHPYAMIRTMAEPDGRAVPLDALADVAEATEIEVGLPDPLLRGLCLIDTPGTGGLDGGHSAITLATLGRADALLFVTRADSELTASELRFLAGAAERISTVAFVLTHTDRYPDWELVLDRNRRVLAAHAPHHAGAAWFPVGSRAAADAVTATGKRAARLRASAGIDPLTAALTARVGARARAIRMGNALAVTARAVHRHLGDTPPAPAVDPALLAERGRTLEKDQRLQLKRQMLALREDLLGLSRSADHQLIDRLPGEVAQRVHGLWLEQENWLRERIAELAEPVALELPGHLRALSPPSRSARPGGVLETVLPALGLGSFAAGAAGALAVGFLAPAAVGAGTILVLYERRRRTQETRLAQQDAVRYVNQVLAQVEVEFPVAAQEALRSSLDRLRALSAPTAGTAPVASAQVRGELSALSARFASVSASLAEPQGRPR